MRSPIKLTNPQTANRESSPLPQPPHFLNLPPEIRNRIYRHLFSGTTIHLDGTTAHPYHGYTLCIATCTAPLTDYLSISSPAGTSQLALQGVNGTSTVTTHNTNGTSATATRSSSQTTSATSAFNSALRCCALTARSTARLPCFPTLRTRSCSAVRCGTTSARYLSDSSLRSSAAL